MLFLSIFLFIIYPADGLIIKGNLETTNDWQFITKFCFVQSDGTASYSIDYPIEYKYINMDLYYDDKWNDVYPSKPLTCEQKSAFSQQVSLNETALSYGCKINTTTITCNYSIPVTNARPRWWFIVFSRCNPETNLSGIKINYIFDFKNGGNLFQNEFSFDEVGIFETSIVLVIAYSILLTITCIIAKILVIKKLLHTTYKIFIATIIFQFFSYVFTLSEYGQFATSGVPTSACGLIGRILDMIANIIFLLILILIAKGYTVTRGKLRTVTCIKIIIVFCLYIGAYLIAFLYSEILFDPGLVNYFYSSPGGLAMIIIKVSIGWVWFCYGIFFTIKNYPEKKKFYIALAIFYSIWFWASPIVILCTNYVIAKYLQEKIGFIVQSLITLIGHVFFISLTFPTKANSNFPFHVRTNQVDFINNKEDTESLENYPHHKEDEVAEKHFGPGNPNEITLQSMFVTQKIAKEKYQLDDGDPYV